jgi:hypothetical protein
MRSRALPFVFAVVLSATAQAQIIWQPTPPPLVTAENTTWFSRGAPVEWNGDLYYQDGVPRFFNAYEMVRSGVFRGIPLYSDTMLEPNSIVFVPISGGRMQPYKRPPVPQNMGPLPATPDAGLNQAPAAPSFAPAYELPSPAEPAIPAVVGTTGRSIATVAPTGVVETVQPPAGVNNIWVNFDGRRWFLDGKAVPYEAARLTQAGTYYGWTVYRRDRDASRIYIPTTAGRLAPYKAR